MDLRLAGANPRDAGSNAAHVVGPGSDRKHRAPPALWASDGPARRNASDSDPRITAMFGAAGQGGSRSIDLLPLPRPAAAWRHRTALTGCVLCTRLPFWWLRRARAGHEPAKVHAGRRQHASASPMREPFAASRSSGIPLVPILIGQVRRNAVVTSGRA